MDDQDNWQDASEKTQPQKFIDKAKELGADEDEWAFEDKLRHIASYSPGHASDCAVHNAPAYEPGRCICGAAKAAQ